LWVPDVWLQNRLNDNAYSLGLAHGSAPVNSGKAPPEEQAQLNGRFGY